MMTEWVEETFAERLLKEVSITSQLFQDVQIICSGEHHEPFKSNVLTLASASPMLKEAFESVYGLEDTICLYLDGITKYGLDLFFNFLFLPSKSFSTISYSELEELQDVTNFLGIPLNLFMPSECEEVDMSNTLGALRKEFGCTSCESSFVTAKLLKRHNRTAHSEDHPHSCLVCGRRCRGPAELSIHVRIHSKEKPFTCHCGKSFTQKSQLTDHTIKVHSTNFNGYFSCQICGKAFMSSALFKQHFSSSHKSLPKVQEATEQMTDADFEAIENIELDTIDEIFACGETDQARVLQDEISRANQTSVLCKLCGKSFTQTSHLNVHMKNSHEGLKPHMCSVCGKQFGLKSNLKKHLRMHERKISEEIEDGKTDSKISPPILTVLSDTSTKFSLSEKTFQEGFACTICGKRFSLETDLSAHIRLHEKKPHICNYCKKTLDSWTSLKIHEANHTGGEAFYCDLCQLRCVSKSALEKHLLTHSGEKPHVCTISGCGKRFVQRSQLNYHVKIVHGPPIGSRSKDYHCVPCQRSFTTNSALRKHERIHSDDRRHSCHICSKSFFQKAHLLTHLLNHFGDRPFACSACQKTFATQFNLNQHVKTHCDAKAQFQCGQPGCTSKYSRAFDLRVHQRKHTGETPFLCLLCPRAFRSRRLLNDHTKSHQDYTPLICKNCSKPFSTPSAIRQHYRRNETCFSSQNETSESLILQEEKLTLADNETQLLVDSLLVP